jgi:hypothetical protein
MKTARESDTEQTEAPFHPLRSTCDGVRPASAAAGLDGFDPWSTYTRGGYVRYLQNVAADTNLNDPGKYIQSGLSPLPARSTAMKAWHGPRIGRRPAVRYWT